MGRSLVMRGDTSLEKQVDRQANSESEAKSRRDKWPPTYSAFATRKTPSKGEGYIVPQDDMDHLGDSPENGAEVALLACLEYRSIVMLNAETCAFQRLELCSQERAKTVETFKESSYMLLFSCACSIE